MASHSTTPPSSLTSHASRERELVTTGPAPPSMLLMVPQKKRQYHACHSNASIRDLDKIGRSADQQAYRHMNFPHSMMWLLTVQRSALFIRAKEVSLNSYLFCNSARWNVNHGSAEVKKFIPLTIALVYEFCHLWR